MQKQLQMNDMIQAPTFTSEFKLKISIYKSF